MTQTSVRDDTSPQVRSVVRLAGPASIVAGSMIIVSQLALLPLPRPAGTDTLTSASIALGLAVAAPRTA